MILFCEGPDVCGKDTQIKMIKKYFAEQDEMLFHELHYTADIVKSENFGPHESKFFSDTYYAQMFVILNYFRENGMSVICNRAHLGEYVYGEKYRGYSGDYVFSLEQVALAAFPKFNKDLALIVLIDNPENLIAREDGFSLSSKLEDKIEEVKKFKETFFKSEIKSKILLNISGKTPEDVFEILKNFISVAISLSQDE